MPLSEKKENTSHTHNEKCLHKLKTSDMMATEEPGEVANPSACSQKSLLQIDSFQRNGQDALDNNEG